MKFSIDVEFVKQKLDVIELYIKRLDIVLGHTEDDIRKDFFKLHTLERLVQLIVDEMIDINTHIIRRNNIRTPDDFQSSFAALAEAGVFPYEFANRIAPTVGLRNRLVHRYENIDPTLLIHMAKQESDDFRQYFKYIASWLKV